MENMDEQGRAYQERRREKTRKRTIRNVTVLIIMVLLLIGLFAAKIFIAPHSAIKSMDYIEVTSQNGEIYRIEVTTDNCRYEGFILMKDPVEGVLVMKNGDRYAASYDANYSVFRIPEKYKGCYQLY